MKKRKQSSFGTGLILLLIGFMFAAIGIGVSKSNADFIENAEEITATIIDIDVKHKSKGKTSGEVFIEYTYNNEIYENRLNHYDSSMYVGKEIIVYVDPENPDNVQSDATSFMLMFIIVGVIVSIFGICRSASSMKNMLDDQKIKKEADTPYK